MPAHDNLRPVLGRAVSGVGHDECLTGAGHKVDEEHLALVFDALDACPNRELGPLSVER